MTKPLHPALARILPYLMIAFMIVLFVFSLFIFSYILLIMLFIGFVLFIIGFIRVRFFNRGKKNTFHEEILIIQRQIQNAGNPEEKKTDEPAQSGHRKSAGRIIEHDDEKNH